ncbi:hypothetical protein [Luteimonas suaedae]|uniref:hypothetical protein n=1 Tax=Luteimonas suaedae TaxID=2605430 RepID=UPI0011EFAE66|nr:hypothetical protein [Luteimonas suaedae]
MDKVSDPVNGGADTGARSVPGAGDDGSFPEMARYRRDYRDASYYSTGRTWSDYAPAYRYGHQQWAAHDRAAFEQAEAALERDWNAARGASRLSWIEARPAVMAAWLDADALAAGAATAG